MLHSQLTNCSGSSNISKRLDEINCKLAKLGSTLYGNTVYLLNNYLSTDEIIDSLTYKRILTFKQVNPDYCSDTCECRSLWLPYGGGFTPPYPETGDLEDNGIMFLPAGTLTYIPFRIVFPNTDYVINGNGWDVITGDEQLVTVPKSAKTRYGFWASALVDVDFNWTAEYIYL